MAKEKEAVDTAKTPNGYTKSQIAASKRYKDDIDIVNALLKDGTLYTLEETDGIINNFKKGRVK
jgi:hypothetical protein